MIVSVRDPRDAVLSVMQRFGDPFDACVGGVGRDCLCARACADAGHDVLRYEDGFFDDPATLRRLAARLGLAAPDAALDRIFADWRTDAVRARAAAVASLPPEQRRDFGARLTLDAVDAGHAHAYRRRAQRQVARGVRRRDARAPHRVLRAVPVPLRLSAGVGARYTLPQTSRATSTHRRSFAHCCSSVSRLPSSVLAKPHCGLSASCSSGR